MSLFDEDMREIYEHSGFHFVKDKEFVKKLFPLFAMWGLESNYQRARAQFLKTDTFGAAYSELFNTLRDSIKMCMDFIRSGVDDAMNILEK